ncbi:hypothetical protein IT575_12185 [bacterium]|nr:hypothetical protein [bacterium]
MSSKRKRANPQEDSVNENESTNPSSAGGVDQIDAAPPGGDDTGTAALQNAVVTDVALPATESGKVTVTVILPFFCSSGRDASTGESFAGKRGKDRRLPDGSTETVQVPCGREVKPHRRERAKPPRTGWVSIPADVIELDLTVPSEAEDYRRWISCDWVIDTAVLTAAEAEIAAANGLSQGDTANA